MHGRPSRGCPALTKNRSATETSGSNAAPTLGARSGAGGPTKATASLVSRALRPSRLLPTSLGNGGDFPVTGKFDVTPLPSGGAGSAATLGGWNLAVSRFSPNPDVAIDLVLYLTSAEVQKRRAIENATLPTIVALCDDPEIAAAQPIVTRWKEVFMNAVPRPSAPTRVKYNAASATFRSAVHETLSCTTPAADRLELAPNELRGGGW